MVPKTFSLDDYDCIGFDLDHTLVHHDVEKLKTVIYQLLAKYLVEVKNYDGKYLYQPVDLNYMQRGLIIDKKRGNVLKLRHDGTIDIARHGTKLLSEDEIKSIYGETLTWDIGLQYMEDFLAGWDGPIEDACRAIHCYYDAPYSLVFGRAVDSKTDNDYETIFRDMHECLILIYGENNEYAKAYSDAAKIVGFHKKIPNSVIKMLENLKKNNKYIILLTGSQASRLIDVASTAFESNWIQYFNMIISYAKKPGFFTMSRPFKKLKILDDRIGDTELYAEGNYNELLERIQKETGNQNPKVLYVGDNAIQDLYPPSHLQLCDTLGIVEELVEPPSEAWGQYLINANNELTLWGSVLSKHTKLCIPSLEYLAKHDIKFRYPSFSNGDNLRGFYPSIKL